VPSPTRRALGLAVLALGGGTGHLFRAIAFARAASTRGHRTRILTSSPFAERITHALAVGQAEVEVVRDDVKRMRDRARGWLREKADDAWVVDTFPRGLVGELEDLPRVCPRILVHRDLTDAYALRAETREAARRFDAIVSPGEEGPLAAALGAVETAPWLIAASTPLLAPPDARRAWGLAATDRRPVVVVATSSHDDHARGLQSLARSLASALTERTAVFGVRLDDDDAPLPLAARLGGVDLLVGGAGYHLVHEAHATRTPFVALPAARTYDEQVRRTRPAERAVDLDDVARRIRSVTPRTAAPPPSIQDGAAQGLELVERVVRDASVTRPDGCRS